MSSKTEGILLVLKIVFNICYSISLLSDESFIDFNTSVAASLRESIYMSSALDDFVADGYHLTPKYHKTDAL